MKRLPGAGAARTSIRPPPARKQVRERPRAVPLPGATASGGCGSSEGPRERKSEWPALAHKFAGAILDGEAGPEGSAQGWRRATRQDAAPCAHEKEPRRRRGWSIGRLLVWRSVVLFLQGDTVLGCAIRRLARPVLSSYSASCFLPGRLSALDGVIQATRVPVRAQRPAT